MFSYSFSTALFFKIPEEPMLNRDVRDEMTFRRVENSKKMFEERIEYILALAELFLPLDG